MIQISPDSCAKQTYSVAGIKTVLLSSFVLSSVQRKTAGSLQSAFPWADKRKVKRPVWREQTRERVGERVRKKSGGWSTTQIFQSDSDYTVCPCILVKCASAWESGSSVPVCCGAAKRDLPQWCWRHMELRFLPGHCRRFRGQRCSWVFLFFFSSMCSISPDLLLHPWGKCREWGECCITATQLAACLYLGLLLLA